MKVVRPHTILAAVLVCAGLSAAAVPAAAATSVDIRIGIPPPAPRAEFIPGPRHGRIWVAGFWMWNGGAYEWVPGHWERVRHGFRYVPARWEPYGAEWVFRPGHWEPVGPPAVVIQPPPPPVYVEQPSSTPAPQAQPPMQPGMWYYCRQPAGYYPSVKECPGGWQAVPPKP
jgi:hypothetical protein